MVVCMKKKKGRSKKKYNALIALSLVAFIVPQVLNILFFTESIGELDSFVIILILICSNLLERIAKEGNLFVKSFILAAMLGTASILSAVLLPRLFGREIMHEQSLFSIFRYLTEVYAMVLVILFISRRWHLKKTEREKEAA